MAQFTTICYAAKWMPSDRTLLSSNINATGDSDCNSHSRHRMPDNESPRRYQPHDHHRHRRHRSPDLSDERWIKEREQLRTTYKKEIDKFIQEMQDDTGSGFDWEPVIDDLRILRGNIDTQNCLSSDFFANVRADLTRAYVLFLGGIKDRRKHVGLVNDPSGAIWALKERKLREALYPGSTSDASQSLPIRPR